jgi:hypothetical protein
VFSDASGPVSAGCDRYQAGDVAAGRERFFLRIGPGELSMGRATGRVVGDGPGGVEIAWDLRFATGTGMLRHLPAEGLYADGVPGSKIVSPHVSTRFEGSLVIGGRTIEVRDAPGMQGHNWGPGVSEHWIWAHANTFEDEPDAVFEALSVAAAPGLLPLPALTVLYLRLRGREVLLNRPDRMLRTRARQDGLAWEFDGSGGGLRLEGRIATTTERSVGLDYVSSDGTTRRVVNSNRADARVRVRGLPGGETVLQSLGAASLELGGRAAVRSVPVRARG